MTENNELLDTDKKEFKIAQLSTSQSAYAQQRMLLI